MSTQNGGLRLNTNNLIFYIDTIRFSISQGGSNDLIKSRNVVAGGWSVPPNFIVFNGTSQYISYSFNNDFRSSFVTIDCWINPSSAVAGDAAIFSTFDFIRYNLGLPPTGYALTWGNNTFNFYYADGGLVGVLKTSSSTSIINKWSNIVLVYNGTNVIFYLNGTLLTSLSGTNPINWTVGSTIVSTVDIGKKSSNAGYFPGSIGSIKVYDRALTFSEVADNYNKFRARFDNF